MANGWTPQELIDWTYDHRILPDQTYLQILEYFYEVAPCQGVFPFADSLGRLAGIVLAKVNHTTREIEVTYAVLATKGLLRDAFTVYQNKFPNYTLKATRYGREVTYHERINKHGQKRRRFGVQYIAVPTTGNAGHERAGCANGQCATRRGQRLHLGDAPDTD